jgi:hypothetical protein
MSSINSKRRSHEPTKSELPVPVRWLEGEALDSEGWHDDWDEGPASHISMLTELPESIEPDPEAERERAYEDEKAWLEDDDAERPAASGGEGDAPETPASAAPDPKAGEAETPAAPEGDGDGDGDESEDDDDERRRGRRRSKTIARKQMLRERRRMLAQGTIPEIVDYERPVRRSDCRDEKRPCLYVSCRYHLYLDVNPMTGSIKLNFPDKEVWELEETCALDVAERGGITLEEVGEIMNLTRERIRQVEVSGLEKLKNGEVKLHTFIDGRELQLDTRPPKRLPVLKDD